MFDFLKKRLPDDSEEIRDNEHDALRSFLLSPAFTGFAKMTRNRMRDHRAMSMSCLLKNDNKSRDYAIRMDEANDILEELLNLKRDIERNANK